MAYEKYSWWQEHGPFGGAPNCYSWSTKIRWWYQDHRILAPVLGLLALGAAALAGVSAYVI